MTFHQKSLALMANKVHVVEQPVDSVEDLLESVRQGDEKRCMALLR